MKKILLTLLLIAPISSYAQPTFPSNMMNMNPDDMNKMMAQMQKMEACMKNVDMSELDKMQYQYRDLRFKINDMCSKGQRNQAQETAVKFITDMKENKTIKKMKQCMGAMMPFSPVDRMEQQIDNKEFHICDA